MTVPSANVVRSAKALVALEGLSVGDAFGQQFFAPPEVIEPLLQTETLPVGPWPFTDDTLMGASVFAVLTRFGQIDQDALASSFSRGYDYRRGYGPSMHRLLMRIGRGDDWRIAAGEQFGGMGSHGNGAAMRVAPIGAYFADDLDRVAREAELSAVVTHTHPEAVAGAIAVAVAAAMASRIGDGARVPTPAQFLDSVAVRVPKGAVWSGIERAMGLPEDASIRLAVAALGNGTGLSAVDTVPFALWVAAGCLTDFPLSMWQAASGLGDRDTICAIVGGIVALAMPSGSFPEEWRAAREPLPEWATGGGEPPEAPECLWEE